jgi:hypothetical protein
MDKPHLTIHIFQLKSLDLMNKLNYPCHKYHSVDNKLYDLKSIFHHLNMNYTKISFEYLKIHLFYLPFYTYSKIKELNLFFWRYFTCRWNRFEFRWNIIQWKSWLKFQMNIFFFSSIILTKSEFPYEYLLNIPMNNIEIIKDILSNKRRSKCA